MTCRDAGDSGKSSPSTLMATSSVTPLPAGADIVRSGVTSSDGAEAVRSGATSSDGAFAVRCGATCSGGAMVVLAWAKTSWADGLRVEAA